MKKISRKLVLLALLFLSLMACKNEPKASLETRIQEQEVKVDESFMPFYDKFHTNEAYQLEHIQFPLQGLPVRTDSTGLAEHDSYTQKEDWIFQTALKEGSGFTRQLTVITPEMLEEFIMKDDHTYGIRRRFAKLAGEWYLIYYAKGPLKN